jgi:hypothetical protein
MAKNTRQHMRNQNTQMSVMTMPMAKWLVLLIEQRNALLAQSDVRMRRRQLLSRLAEQFGRTIGKISSG